ncbi:Flp family type IVb pilin [Rhodocyclus purpureus]|uniref:Flp family type IVb pilin n=1 Tax=Rhodocyclus purpureus TaxID=1067 RepID=UPI0019143B39|nr:Flp family type IVb pilin [Rhodocyclus purpureus]MBK5915465.1 hypothetical protein [Rhodocyclus purpureus]
MMKLAMKKRQKGVTMIEYALIAALVGVAAVTALVALGGNISDKFEAVSTELTTTR